MVKVAVDCSWLTYRSESEVAEFALGRVFFVSHPPALALQGGHLELGQVELVGVAQLHVVRTGRDEANIGKTSQLYSKNDNTKLCCLNPTVVGDNQHPFLNAKCEHTIGSSSVVPIHLPWKRMH